MWSHWRHLRRSTAVRISSGWLQRASPTSSSTTPPTASLSLCSVRVRRRAPAGPRERERRPYRRREALPGSIQAWQGMRGLPGTRVFLYAPSNGRATDPEFGLAAGIFKVNVWLL